MGGESYCEMPIYGRAGTCIVVDYAVIHTRMDPADLSQLKGRRIMHKVFARGGWLQNEIDKQWRGPALPQVCNPFLLARALIPERLAVAPEPHRRRLYSLWSPAQCEFVASGFDRSYYQDSRVGV